MIIAIYSYYAWPGREDALQEQRLLASTVRVSLGLPRGRAYRIAQGKGDLPTVLWTCEFTDSAAHEADLAARAWNPGYQHVREGMAALHRRVERVLYQVEDGNPRALLAANVLQVWWPVPDEYVTMLVDQLKETAADARAPGDRGDAIVRRAEANPRVPAVICAAAFPDAEAAANAWAGATSPAEGDDAKPSPLAPRYSLWAAID